MVHSNDPEKPRFNLQMTGSIESIAGFEKPAWHIGRVKRGATQSTVVKVTGKEAAAIRLADVKSNDAARVRAEATTADGVAALRLTFAAGRKDGPVSARVTARTGLAAVPELDLWVSAYVSGDVVMEPTSVFFSAFNPDQPPVATLRVYSLSGKPLRLAGLADETGAVTGTLEKRESDWLVTLRLTRDVQAPQGKVRIRTGSPDSPVVEVGYLVGKPRATLRAMQVAPGLTNKR